MPKRNSAEHVARMKARRERQLARVPGFTAVRNQRHEYRLSKLEWAVIAEQDKLPATARFAPAAIKREAERRLLATLPHAPFGRKLSAPKPTKNNSPVYRKQVAA